MKLSGLAMSIVFLAIFVTMVGISSTYPAGARFMTFVVGIPAILLCLLQLALDIREMRRAPEVGDDRSDIEKAEAQLSQLVGRQLHFDVSHQLLSGGSEEKLDPAIMVRREVIVWGYILALIFGIILFGFHLTVPLFLIAFLRLHAHARASWQLTLGLTAIASAVMFIMFERVLKMTLHTGFITDFLLERFGGS
jgi:hypothetical protein